MAASFTINLATLLSQTKDGDKGIKVAQDEKDFYDHQRKLQLLQLKRIEDENEARKTFSENIFTVTVLWMASILFVVFCSGMGKLKLSDGVLIALITTTTANVFGFLYVVVNYLFNKEKST